MNQYRVMLLIDGDNVSADVIEQAVAMLLAQHGALHVRRAYGTAEAAVKHQDLFRRLGIRPMVNLATGKNSTDIALAVDAIDLVLAERPEVVAIASSDSDFAPLVARLREKGCRVVGFGQQGKTGDDTLAVYDDYTVLVHRKGSAKTEAKATVKPVAKKAVRQRVTVAPPSPPPPPPSPAAPPPAPPAAPAPAPRPAIVQALIEALPALTDGAFIALNKVAEAMRAQKLLSKNASSSKLLRQFDDYFELTPDKKPDRVRLRIKASR